VRRKEVDKQWLDFSHLQWGQPSFVKTKLLTNIHWHQYAAKQAKKVNSKCRVVKKLAASSTTNKVPVESEKKKKKNQNLKWSMQKHNCNQKRNLPARGARNAVQMPHAAPVAKKSRCSDLPVKKQQTKNKKKTKRGNVRTEPHTTKLLLLFFSKMFDATRQLKTRKYHLPIWFLEDCIRVPCVRLMYLSSTCWNNVAVQKANNAEM
jgi:hypothetical protein